MRQAIITKYLGPTNTKGARIHAKCAAGKITVPWKHDRSTEENHELAALLLIDKLGWGNNSYLEGGTLPGGFFVFVQIPRE